MQEENQPTNGLIGLFLWALRLKMEEVTLSRRPVRPGRGETPKQHWVAQL
jgi:hypothetical protein